MDRRTFLRRAALIGAAALPLSSLTPRAQTVIHRYAEGWRRVEVVVDDAGEVFSRISGNYLGRMVNGRYTPFWELR